MISTIRDLRRNPWIIPLAVSHRLHRSKMFDSSISVMKEDWDNLIILDACRFDLFKSCWNGPGNLSKVISKGSNTPEWLRRSFNDEYPDTVYVSANPQVQANNISKRFHSHLKVWESDWNDDLQTVLPEVMSQKTISTVKKYPNKRIISHWIQPHYPFIGKTGRDIEHGTITGEGAIENRNDNPTIWDQLQRGKVNREIVWQAYKENLELAIPEIKRTIKNINGKTIVTSDHGNVFGRFGLYGHPGNKYIKELVEVPWLNINDQRRDIYDEGLMEQSGQSEVIEERLRNLGYK